MLTGIGFELDLMIRSEVAVGGGGVDCEGLGECEHWGCDSSTTLV